MYEVIFRGGRCPEEGANVQTSPARTPNTMLWADDVREAYLSSLCIQVPPRPLRITDIIQPRAGRAAGKAITTRAG